MPQELSEEQIRQIAEALAHGSKVMAIKLYRDFTGEGLTAAKAFVEQPLARLLECAPPRPARPAECRVVNNRVFLVGLDDLYRTAMKRHERDELLAYARETARILAVAPANGPLEGYYSEDEKLAEYFQLMRALQAVPRRREAELRSVAGFFRLRAVAESRLFGRSSGSSGRYLLSGGRDPLSVALDKTFPQWDVATLLDTAYQEALAADDVSLVGLAALRESVVLYAMAVASGVDDRPEPEYAWEVDATIQARAQEFVKLFNGLFGHELPEPVPENAAAFWNASKEWTLLGRCVRLGIDPMSQRHYHWAIDRDQDDHLVVKEFWDTDLWTTSRYREERMPGYCQLIGVPPSHASHSSQRQDK